MKPATSVTIVFLLAIALVHVLRIVVQLPVTAGETEIPMWASVVAVICPGALALWLWREHRA